MSKIVQIEFAECGATYEKQIDWPDGLDVPVVGDYMNVTFHKKDGEPVLVLRGAKVHHRIWDTNHRKADNALIVSLRRASDPSLPVA